MTRYSRAVDRFSGLRQAVQGNPLGERIVELAVSIAVAHLQANHPEAARLSKHFLPHSAASLERSLAHYFGLCNFTEGSTEQQIMDSVVFQRWQTEWLPTFLRTTLQLEDLSDAAAERQLRQWLIDGTLGERGT